MQTLLAVVVGALTAAGDPPRPDGQATKPKPTGCWVIDGRPAEVAKGRPDTPAFALLTRTPLGRPVWGEGSKAARPHDTYFGLPPGIVFEY